MARRLGALEAFYAPLGEPEVRTRWIDASRVLVGAIDVGRRERPDDELLVWGGPLPAHLSDARSLLDASDRDLRALDGVVAAFASDGVRASVLSGAGGITTLYESRSSLGWVWATHAVAAAWLARGEVRVDPGSVPELLSRDFVGGRRTLIEGALAVPSATRVDLTAEPEPAVVSWWPASERWSLVPEAEAQALAERALLESLGRRLERSGPVHIGLTGGLDSRVVALAIAELGLDASSFTWGEPDWADVVAAERVAAVLDIPHPCQEVDHRDDERALGMIDAEVRFTEGLTPVRFAGQTWPDDLGAAVFGAGGESGRAFYYDRAVAQAFPQPSVRELERIFDATRTLVGASPEARLSVRESERTWVADAEALGLRGWRCLDAIYVEQRVQRWGRAMLPAIEGIFVGAFATPEVTRALVSLPLEERLTDGFHRRFLERAPALAPPPPRPAPTRSRVRRVTSRVPGARRVAAAIRQRTRPTPGGTWFAAAAWRERPRLRAWLADEVLRSPLLGEALGTGWLEQARDGFLRDESRATALTLLAAAPVALDTALRELDADRRARPLRVIGAA